MLAVVQEQAEVLIGDDVTEETADLVEEVIQVEYGREIASDGQQQREPFDPEPIHEELARLPFAHGRGGASSLLLGSFDAHVVHGKKGNRIFCHRIRRNER
jgi:hypothetical protein